MNEEIRNKAIREEDLEKVNGGTDLDILPGFDITKREQRNREINQSPMELDDNMLKNATGGIGLTAILNPFGNDYDCPLPGSDNAHNTPGKG